MTSSVPAATSFAYTGNGATTAFSFPLRFLENADVQVYLDDVLKTITTHYTLTGAGGPSGGTVTFVSAPASGVAIELRRSSLPKQTVDLSDSGRTPGDTLETQLDRLAMAGQDQSERIETLEVVAEDLEDAVADAEAAATAAAASAAAAATAETNAETAETNAEAAQAAAEAAAAAASSKLPLDGSAPMTGPIRFTHQASPSNPAAGLLSVFAKSDNKLYTRSSAGIEQALGGNLGFVTPEDYGAVGNGVADDTAAVQSAFSSGSNVYLPGTYKLTDTIAVPNTSRRLYKGRGKTVTTFTANMNKPYLKLDNSSGSVYWVAFEDLLFDSTNAGTRSAEAGISLSGSVATNWEMVKIHNCGFLGLYHGVLIDKVGNAGGEGQVAKGEYIGLWSDQGSNGLQPAYVIRATTSINNGIVIQDGVYSFSEAGIAIGDGSIHTGDIVISGLEFFGDNVTVGNACIRINGGTAYAYNISVVGCQFEGVDHSLDLTNVDGMVVRGCNWGGPSRLNLVGCVNIQIDYSEIVSPAQITSNQNDYDPSDGSSGIAWANAGVLRLNSDASRNITGLKAYGDNRYAVLANTGSFDIVLVDASASSTAANRFSFGRDLTIGAGQALEIIYDPFTSRWRSVASLFIDGSVGTTDNRLVRSDGTSGKKVQSTGITVDDSNNVSNMGNLAIAATSTGAFTLAWTDDTAAAVTAVFRRTRTTAAANDQLGAFSMQGKDSAGNNTTYGTFGLMSTDVTDASEDGLWFWTTLVAGASATRFQIGAGVFHPSVTGGDKGNNTLNYGTLYANGNPVPGTISNTATYDPGSLADAAGVTTTVTVTGAALGDIALASFSLDLQGITVTAWVSATNTVSVRFQNESGGVLDLASGTLKAMVFK